MKEDKSHLRVWKARGTNYIAMPLVVFILLVLALAVAALLIWSVKRNIDAELRVQAPGELRTLMPSIVGLTHGSLDTGNRVEILQNGDGFFPRVMADIAAARHSVHVETYIWYDGKLASQLVTLLAQKARQGVHVRVLVDGTGGRQLDGDDVELLKAAGAEIAHFHPIRISNLGRLNNRDHRKLWIIDGRIAYTGGHGIADTWLGNGQDKEHFRDTAIRMEGPVVNRLQGAFSENWIEETGDIPAGAEYFPPLLPSGTTPVHVAFTSPAHSISSVQVLYYLAIKAARHEIIIQNPYLLPDKEAIEALEEAVARGVDVKIMVPSDNVTDSAPVQHASHHHFGTLLKRGVKLWEYDRTLLHQKVIIVDGLWASVGSTNFDDRSFQLNDEISVGMVDPAVAAQLEAAFEADLKYARRVQLDQWKDRGAWHKFVDGLAYLGRSQL
ncbi:MAG TPA: cardiolipin synthase [Thermoanaerobaculia bacterium]|jgi:cardiolipin synthase